VSFEELADFEDCVLSVKAAVEIKVQGRQRQPAHD
jgi:hypothetical protein